MSFANTKCVVEEGDTVIIYVNPQAMYALQVKPLIATKKGDMVENIFQTAYGALKVQELVGKKFGHKVQFSRGWGYLLHPTPELWTLNLKHRTQILYTPDISLIVMQLDLKAGSVIVESGTGSGSLSHAILRAIAPTGHLHTFDFHQQRVEIVTQEFSDHGWEPFVTAKQRDACKDGFDLENVADAVFLDLPNPWLAIPHSVKALKKSGGRICTFSPCIEQTQKTCEGLLAEGFKYIETMECLQREYQVKNITLPEIDDYNFSFCNTPETNCEGNQKKDDRKFRAVLPALQMAGHTGYLTFATWPRQSEKCQT
ncbi:hypothetical protein DAPPUDRAFT_306325 [Daphnia pulex]|uniref:tRNA (adenine(58)-N(1))-methyltransferase catalytic subunit TRMT61A n=1 Tax=Daphnia pulex TaxID=6669 RepID=E9GX16_DAPPU|nr:hypothetical protein DAPPUDRAFT_306325 [Daphnia pulex]|eukprot:EFX75994.1 hypothetical protein DAPPUDRAFT_306325 [Daphnia pulex]